MVGLYLFFFRILFLLAAAAAWLGAEATRFDFSCSKGASDNSFYPVYATCCMIKGRRGVGVLGIVSGQKIQNKRDYPTPIALNVKRTKDASFPPEVFNLPAIPSRLCPMNLI